MGDTKIERGTCRRWMPVSIVDGWFAVSRMIHGKVDNLARKDDSPWVGEFDECRFVLTAK